MAAIAKKRSQYQNTKHKKEKGSNKAKITQLKEEKKNIEKNI